MLDANFVMEEEAVCGRVAVHSQAAKIEVLAEKILEMNTRGDTGETVG